MKKILSILLTLALSLALLSAAMPAGAETPDHHPKMDNLFVYELIHDDAEAKITAYYGTDAELVIPSSLGGVPVTEIAGIAYSADFITAITVPASVTHIETGAFYGMKPTSFTVEEGNPVYHSEGNCLIETESKTLVGAFPGSVIPTDGSVTVIGESVFRNREDLTAIDLPDMVTRIGDAAFSHCKNLSTVHLPDALTVIDDYGFYGCAALKTLAFPSGLTEIGTYAFYESGMTDFDFPDALTRIGECALEKSAWFNNCPNGIMVLGKWACGYKGERGEEAVVIPDGIVGVAGGAFWAGRIAKLPDSIRYIGSNAFQWCDFDDSSMPKNLVSIDGSGFHGCGLTEVVLPEGFQSMGDRAFFDNHNLTSLTIPNSVTHIGESPTYGCGELVSLTVEESNPLYHSDGNCVIETATGTLVMGCQSSVIPSDGSVTAIGAGAFAGNGTTDVVLPASVTSIGDRAYMWCNGLYRVTLPDTVTSLGEGAFYNCMQLKEVTLPGSLTTINASAFESCERLTTVTIGEGVTSIGKNAFGDCEKLKVLNLPDSLTSISWYAFERCKALTHITLPKHLTEIDYSAFSFCESLIRVSIPKSVTRIAPAAFYYCKKIETVYYGGTEDDRVGIDLGANNDPLEKAKWVYEADGLPPIPGDANDDDSMDMKDVLLIRQFIAGLNDEIEASVADVNGDRSVDMKDVLVMRKIIAGLLPAIA